MGSAAITLQMQPTGTAYVKSMQGNSWPQSMIVIFQDAGGKPVDLTGSVPRIFAGPNGVSADGTVMDAFSGTAQFGVTPDMTAIPGQYACSFSLPNTSCPDFKVDRLTLKVVLQQDGIYYAFLNQVPGTNEDIQTQLNNIRTEMSSKITEQDIQTAISGVTVGAVQLLRDSATLPTLHGWSQNSSTDSADAGGGFYRLPLSSNITEILQNTGVATIHGATYTESFYFRTDSTTLGFSFNFYELNHEKSNIVQAVVQNLGSGLYRAWATATVEDTAIRAIDIRDLVYSDGSYIEIGKPKFEYGNKPTDYSESDADFNDRIGTINQTLTAYTSEISQNAKDITLRVLTSTYDTYTAANDSAVSGAASAAASAKSAASTAQSAANNAASAAATAQSTATGAASAASLAQSAADSAQSTASSKAKVFTSQPSPPYAAGDVWKNGSAVSVCLTARSSGSFTASDWSLSGDVTANNTAADTAKVGGTSSATVLNNISTAQTAAGNAGAAASTAQSAANSAASAASTAQSTANNAANAAATAQSTATGAASAASLAQSAAASAQSTASSKAKVFTSQPSPPYAAGDVWKNGSAVSVCLTARSSGSFAASDWSLSGDVTANNTAADTAKVGGTSSATVLNNISTAQTAAGNAGAAASTAQSAANSAASAASTAQSTANNAANAAATAQSTANSKAKVFTVQPTPPYSVGDLWTNSAGDTMVCKTARSSGSYAASDWQPASAVTVTRIQTAEQKITPQAITSTVASNLTGNQIASIINQSATTVTISAQKLDLTGYITATSLSTAGATTINGANITTGTISADRIDTTNLKVQKIYNSTSEYYAQIGSYSMPVANEQGEQYDLTFTGISLNSNNALEGGLYAAEDYNPELGSKEKYIKLFPGDDDECNLTLATTGTAKYIFLDCNSSLPGGSTVSNSRIEIGSSTTHYGEGVLISVGSCDPDGANSKGTDIEITPDNGINIMGNFPTAPLNSAAWRNENAGYWDARVTRIGNMCFVYGNITGDQVSSGTTIMNIPYGFRPKIRTSVNTFDTKNYDGTHGIRFDIMPDGKLIYLSTDGTVLAAWLGLQLFYAID